MIEREQIEKLLTSLRKKYSAQLWATTYPQLPISDWLSELGQYTPDHVKHALSRLSDDHAVYPPTAMQFAKLCALYRPGSERNSLCTADGCCVRTPADRCLFHPAGISTADDRRISSGIERNRGIVGYYLFLRKVRPFEVYAPDASQWPENAKAAIERLPLNAGETASDYIARVAVETMRRCGVADATSPKHKPPTPNHPAGNRSVSGKTGLQQANFSL